jgi:phospholipid:diacylglycerol acyltransferase
MLNLGGCNVGGDRIWGNQESAPDDPENATDTHGKFFSFRRESDMKAQAETSTSMWANWASAAANVVNKNKLEGKSNSSDEIDEKDKTTSSPPKESELNKDTVWPNLTMNEAGTYVLSHTPNMFQRMYESNYSNGFETDTKVLHNNRKNHRKVGVCRYLGSFTS